MEAAAGRARAARGVRAARRQVQGAWRRFMVVAAVARGVVTRGGFGQGKETKM